MQQGGGDSSPLAMQPPATLLADGHLPNSALLEWDILQKFLSRSRRELKPGLIGSAEPRKALDVGTQVIGLDFLKQPGLQWC